MTSKKTKLTDEEKKLKQKEQRIYKTYGLTLEQYDKMLDEQNHSCRICQGHKDISKLCVDHIHIAGFKKMPPEEKIKYVRGLLCFLCNTGLKGFDKTKDGEKNRRRLEGTYMYFKTFKLKGE